MILQIFDDPALCARLGEQAAGETARQFTWERNARDLDRALPGNSPSEAIVCGAHSSPGVRPRRNRRPQMSAVSNRNRVVTLPMNPSRPSPPNSPGIVGLFPELLGVGGVQEASRQSRSRLAEYFYPIALPDRTSSGSTTRAARTNIRPVTSASICAASVVPNCDLF